MGWKFHGVEFSWVEFTGHRNPHTSEQEGLIDPGTALTFP